MVYSAVVGATTRSVVVVPLEGSGEVEISDGGMHPAWSPDGRHIYFLRDNLALYRVPVTTEPVFRITGNEQLVYRSPSHMHFGILPDGRVLVSQPRVSETSARIRVILNFEEYAERLVEGRN